MAGFGDTKRTPRDKSRWKPRVDSARLMAALGHLRPTVARKVCGSFAPETEILDRGTTRQAAPAIGYGGGRPSPPRRKNRPAASVLVQKFAG
jgi:hypothetical protein